MKVQYPISGITIFYDTEGKRMGSAEEILPISLFKGMIMTVHGFHEEFEVDSWNYHYGHPDEDAGLRIILRKID